MSSPAVQAGFPAQAPIGDLLAEKGIEAGAALRLAETALGENLTWLFDHFDLSLRQGDVDVRRRLTQLNNAHRAVAIALAKAGNPITVTPPPMRSPDGAVTSYLLEALIEALPYVETAEGDPLYKQDRISAVLKRLRAAIAKAEGR